MLETDAINAAYYWKDRAIKAELALSGKTQFDEVAAALSSERKRLRERVEEMRKRAEKEFGGRTELRYVVYHEGYKDSLNDILSLLQENTTTPKDMRV